MGPGFLESEENIVFGPAHTYGVTFAISRDLGTIQATQAPIVWAMGYTTDLAINYAVQFDSSSQNARSPYYKLHYQNDEDLVTLFISFILRQVPVLIFLFRSLIF